MPSPIAHALVGLSVHALSARDKAELDDRRRLALVVGAALAPDLDLALRFVDGRNHHNQEVHSVGFALIAALAVALAWRVARRPRALPAALAVGLAWCSHLLLDYLNVDTHPPIGLMAWWPLTDRYFKSALPIFLDVGRGFDWTTVKHNALAGAWECAVLAPLLYLAWRFRLKHASR